MIPGQPCGFSSADSADRPLAPRRQQRADARPLLAACTTAAHVCSDPHALGKAPPAGLIGAGILPTLPRGVGADVMAGGRTDIHRGVALEMGRTHLGAQADPPRSGHGG